MNKKRAVSADATKVLYGNLAEKGEASVALAGTIAEFTLFNSINAMWVNMIANFIMGDDEDEQKKVPRDNAWYQIIGQTLVDLNPLPPFAPADDLFKGFINRFVFYPMDVMNEGDFKLGEDDGYERWLRTKGGVPVFYKGAPKGYVDGLLRFAGPYGQYITDVENTLLNLKEGGQQDYLAYWQRLLRQTGG